MELPKMTEDKQEVKMPAYLLAETKENTSIFNLNLSELIFEKMFILFEKIQTANNNLETAKIELQLQKDKLLLETDFKAELGESRPTVAMKEAYMKPHLANLENKVDKYANEVVYYKDKVNVLNDLIKSQRLMLRLEGALTE